MMIDFLLCPPPAGFRVAAKKMTCFLEEDGPSKGQMCHRTITCAFVYITVLLTSLTYT